MGKLFEKRYGNGLAPYPGFSRRSRALHGRFSRLRNVSLFYPFEMEVYKFIFLIYFIEFLIFWIDKARPLG